MAINKRERNLLIATITLVGVGVNYFLATYLIGKWQPLRGQLTAKLHELEGMQTTVAHKAEWQASFNDLKRNLKGGLAFETSNDVLKKIQEVGKTSGILPQSSRSLRCCARFCCRSSPAWYLPICSILSPTASSGWE